jgi:hypothetical protein
VPKGSLAEYLWHNDTSFRYGIEYGAILALMLAFNVDKDEL